MSTKVKPIPEGYNSITPYLIVKDASKAIDFYKKGFGAVEKFRMEGPDGGIAHAELKFGDSHVMLGDESPAMNAKGPKSLGGSPVGLMFYVENVDKQVQLAVEFGAKIIRPLQDQFYGDRSATLEDPFGHQWTVATHIEDVPPEEMEKRTAKLFGGQK